MGNSDIENSFHGEMNQIYLLAKAICKYNAKRFLNMVNEHGGLKTAKILLNQPGYSDGFTALWECGRLDLSMEALVLKSPWSTLFSEHELNVARKRLTELGYTKFRFGDP